MNVIAPSMGLVGRNNTTDPPCVMCHLPARGPTVPTDPWWLMPLVAILPLSVVLLLVFGVPLARQYLRRRRALKAQLEAGVLTKEEFERLK